MHGIEKRLADLGVTLPDAPAPAANGEIESLLKPSGRPPSHSARPANLRPETAPHLTTHPRPSP